MGYHATKFYALSGCVWGLIAYVIGHRAFGGNIWGGVVAAPLIGLLIGYLGHWLRGRPLLVQIVASLCLLYVAATCFGIGTGIVDILTRSRLAVTFSAVLIQHVSAVLWGLTFGWYALALWPLAFFNHTLAWRAGAGRIQSVRDESD